jgi:hypothetical protein
VKNVQGYGYAKHPDLIIMQCVHVLKHHNENLCVYSYYVLIKYCYEKERMGPVLE